MTGAGQIPPPARDRAGNWRFEGRGLCVPGVREALFADIAFSLSGGEVLRVAGANGAGKTTLLRLCLGFFPPPAGSLCWNGRDIHGNPAAHRARSAHVGHRNGLRAELTVRENLSFGARLGGRRLSRHEERKLLQEAGLERLAEQPAGVLSAGQQRRLALLRLLSGTALLWVLDEPATALDQAGLGWLDFLVRQHLEKGGGVIVSSHSALSFSGPAVVSLPGTGEIR